MLFNELGRKIPTPQCRVFANAERNFYKTNEISIDFEEQHKKAMEYSFIDHAVSFKTINEEQKEIYRLIKNNNNYSNLLHGASIPFAISIIDLTDDIGTQLEDFFLPLIKKNYEKNKNGSWFKAVLQGNNLLKNSLEVTESSGYHKFINAVKVKGAVGYYFPTAFQEYDIASQRNQINILPDPEGFDICLSGHIEASYSLIMQPNLLFSEKNYSPILCLSALEHRDKRMVPIFKSYGPHLEFWLLSQMMTQTQTQVSEQWSGGLTIYRNI